MCFPQPCASGMLRSASENGGNAGVGQVKISRGFGMAFASLGSTINVPTLVRGVAAMRSHQVKP